MDLKIKERGLAFLNILVEGFKGFRDDVKRAGHKIKDKIKSVRDARRNNNEEETSPEPEVQGRKGIYFNVASWYAFRFAISIATGTVIVMALQVVVNGAAYLGGTSLPNIWWIWCIIIALTATYIGLPEKGDPEDVPGKNFISVVTWIGSPLPLYRETGRYKWLGRRLGLGRLDVQKKNFTTPFEKDVSVNVDKSGPGFIPGGSIPFKVWNQADSSAVGKTIIKAPAKNRAEVKATLTLMLEVVDPQLLLDSDDPALDIGERAREEFRELVNQFVDTDMPSLQGVTAEVIMGRRLITVFLPRAFQGSKAGAMLRDKGGNAIFTVIKADPDKEDEKEAYMKEVAEFAKRVMKEADEEFLALVTKNNPDGTVEVNSYELKITKPLNEVLDQLGLRLKRATFGDIILSEPVTAAANQASAETDERIAELADADTKKAVRKKMLPDEDELKNPAWETTMILAEAKGQGAGGAIKIVLTPGADSLTRAAIAGASQIGGNK